MSRWPQLEHFLQTDPHDVGCEQAMDVLHVYVDLVLSGAHPEVHLPGVTAHLSACGPCDDDFQGLLAAARSAEQQPAPERKDPPWLRGGDHPRDVRP